MKLREPGRLRRLGGEAASVYQRVEDNAFHLSKVDRLLPWRAVASAEGAEDDVTNNTVKKIKKSWSSVQIFDMPLQTTGKQEKRKYQKC